MGAHPRSRGENTAAAIGPYSMTGSSPLTRGKHGTLAQAPGPSRLIPAHAGKTTVRTSRTETFKGSSPLTRGKHGFGPFGLSGGGLIPAHAGKTSAGLGSASASRAHPRSRGENLSGLGGIFPGIGSSPLTRGKLALRPAAAGRCGLIPAHAGKTLNGQAITTWTKAHPRSRGENFGAGDVRARAAGSSPLTRGKPCHQARRLHARGLIPAHAGKTGCDLAT